MGEIAAADVIERMEAILATARRAPESPSVATEAVPAAE
jgi:hypothetical protein